MSRPSTEAEYLARMMPASASTTGFGRRRLLKSALAGAGLLGATGLLTACGGGGGTDPAAVAAATGPLTFGSRNADPVPRAATEEIIAGFGDPGIQVTTNFVDNETFQENINNYLQGQPDDVFTWFSGYRMTFFAQQGLVGDISDVWQGISNKSEALKAASTADGAQYLVPFTTYPWAIFYRPSVFAERGYTAPATLDELVALSTQMQADGLNPIAFADKDGWPAMGTFDQLNLRINGYPYHVRLMAGEESWDSPQVKEVFDTWRRLLPFHQPDSLGRTWQEAAQSLQQKQSGMYLLGMFMGQQFTAPGDLDDLDFFTFPEIDPAIGTGAIEAPVDGYMMAARPRNEAAAKKFLGYLATAQAEDIAVAADPSIIATSSDAATSGYNALQQKAVEFVANAEEISQFLDRDTRPDFASTVMIPAIQQFIANPDDIDGLTRSIESQKQSIFTS